jgi:hypothetical protein
MIAPGRLADHPHLRFQPGHDRNRADAVLRAAFDDPVAGVRSPTTCLSGGLIGLGDGIGLLHTSDAFLARH